MVEIVVYILRLRASKSPGRDISNNFSVIWQWNVPAQWRSKYLLTLYLYAALTHAKAETSEPFRWKSAGVCCFSTAKCQLRTVCRCCCLTLEHRQVRFLHGMVPPRFVRSTVQCSRLSTLCGNQKKFRNYMQMTVLWNLHLCIKNHQIIFELISFWMDCQVMIITGS